MKSFTYTIKDEIGLHARPAGMLVKESKKYESKIILDYNGKRAEANRMLAVMQLGIRHGTKVKVLVEGPDEHKAAKELEKFFKANV